ncbi:MAG: Na+/H+ antiporter subunit E [Bacillus sp. (in: Bacteria)]|nr:Na+/H+ antiporter subunit E [Bacillus sp. (in: firmicutes)]MCM1426766.1 Na+/H+ antiporter subunit E [Eubacterium sp.]
MYLLYFLLWVIFNGNFTLEIAVFGVIIAAALFAFTCKFTDYSIAAEKKILCNFFRLLHYVFVLVIEIVKANFAVIRFILSEKEEVQPALVTFKADIQTSMGRAALANAITLTPGTITVLLDDNTYTVHCLDETLAEGLDKSVFVDMIKKCE